MFRRSASDGPARQNLRDTSVGDFCQPDPQEIPLADLRRGWMTVTSQQGRLPDGCEFFSPRYVMSPLMRQKPLRLPAFLQLLKLRSLSIVKEPGAQDTVLSTIWVPQGYSVIGSHFWFG